MPDTMQMSSDIDLHMIFQFNACWMSIVKHRPMLFYLDCIPVIGAWFSKESAGRK